MKMDQQQRGLFDQPFTAIYTPTEEVIVKLNGVYKTIHANQFKHVSNSNDETPLKSFHQKYKEKSQPNGLIESTNLPSSLTGPGYKHLAMKKKFQPQQQQQSKRYYIPNNFVSTPDDDDDNSLMNDYSFNYYYSDAPQMSRARLMHKNRIQRPIHLRMKSSMDLSQNRDAANLARGRDTSLLI